ncbi:40276_t:CDS:2, partial [Gigaspora margarita]
KLELRDYEEIDQVSEVQNEGKSGLALKSEKESIQEEWNQNNYKEKNKTKEYKLSKHWPSAEINKRKDSGIVLTFKK